MQHCDKILQKQLVCLNYRHYISAKILEDLTGTKIPQKKRLMATHINTAVINTSIPADEVIFAQTKNNVKGRRSINGNLFVAFRVMQNVIACSTKIPWTPIRANYVAQHISTQFLLTENLLECKSHR